MKKLYIQHKQGSAMLFTMIVIVLVSSLVVYGIGGPVVRDYKVSSEALKARKSYFLAESSIEDIFYRLKNNISVASSETFYDGTNYNTITKTDQGSGITRVTSVSNLSGRQRTVTTDIQSTPGSSGTTTHLNYAIQSGLGGFVFSNNATINGSVYSNGSIVGSNGARINGSAYAATSLPLSSDQANSTPATPPSSVNFGTATATQDFAQSFQVTTQERLNKVRFYIKRTSSAPGNLTVRVTSDNAGKPSTTTMASLTITASTVGTSFGWMEAVFTTNPILDTGTTYWLVLDAGTNATKYYTIGTNTGTYATGNAMLGAYAGTWGSAQTYDGYFSVWIGGITSTISAVTITGSANASSVTSSTVTGTLYCQTGSGNNKACNTTIAPPSPVNLPITAAQIDTWKNEAAAGGVTNGTVTLSSSQSMGPRKIVGNLNVDNNKTLTLTGTLWVTGTINISNNGVVRLASSYGTSSGTLIADGPIYLSNNGYFQGSGSTGSYPIAITTHNGNGAIVISNNAGAVVLYAPYGEVTVSNNGGAAQITAETISLSNNATITYNSSLASASVTSNPAASTPAAWNVSSWKETE